MISIDHIVLEATDPHAAAKFYREALQLDERVQVRETHESSEGFRGFTMGLDVADPAAADRILAAAGAVGAEILKPAAAQPWGGYSGVIRTPDGAVIKVATSDNKKSDSDATIQRVVLLLGVEHVAVTKEHYVNAGMEIATEAGNKYIEFSPAAGRITLGAYKRDGLAKEFAVAPEGSGSHRMAIVAAGPSLVDPDGFAWESISGA
jgi:uncharacterized glyoxalase superfamily protein PhnB